MLTYAAAGQLVCNVRQWHVQVCVCKIGLSCLINLSISPTLLPHPLIVLMLLGVRPGDVSVGSSGMILYPVYL